MLRPGQNQRGALLAAALSGTLLPAGCGLSDTYDGRLSITGALGSASAKQPEERPAILIIEGGGDGSRYELRDNAGSPPCSFDRTLSGGEAYRGTCVLSLAEGRALAELTSAKAEASPGDRLTLTLDWATRAEAADAGAPTPLDGTLRTVFQGRSR